MSFLDIESIYTKEQWFMSLLCSSVQNRTTRKLTESNSGEHLKVIAIKHWQSVLFDQSYFFYTQLHFN